MPTFTVSTIWVRNIRIENEYLLFCLMMYSINQNDSNIRTFYLVRQNKTPADVNPRDIISNLYLT